MPTLNPNVTVDVDNSISAVTGISYLQPTSFKLSIDRKHYPNLEFFCQSILHTAAHTDQEAIALSEKNAHFSQRYFLVEQLSAYHLRKFQKNL